jgi:tRNA(Leu) C34 or U34 (ribose-2'-O)-methylase TrmL
MGNTENELENDESKTFKLNQESVKSNEIAFFTTGLEGKEILKFTEDKMFLYGKETTCPQDIIEGMRSFLASQSWFETVQKAQKYDDLLRSELK